MAEQVGGVYYDVTLDTGQMVRQSRQAEGALDSLGSRFGAITIAVKVLAASLALVKAAQIADDMRLLAARVQVAAGSLEKAGAAMSELVAISTRTQTSVAANAQVFQRLNQSLLQMGGTQEDTLQLTELLGKAIKVSGASAQESSAAMLQFGQALGSGKLAGDELRSLMETAPYLMRQLADGLGVPIGALKQLGEEGKLTADVVVNAMRKAADQINSDFAKIPATLSSAMQLSQDAASRLAQQLDELSGSSAVLTGAATGVGEVLDRLARQLAETSGQASQFGRNDAVRSWADATRIALSYVVDAVDVTWQALSVFGRNVAFVFTSVGREIGGIAAQAAAVARGDLSGAVEIGRAMRADADRRRAELDASDAKTLANRKLFGQQMREAWEQGTKENRGFTPTMGGSKLTPPKSTDTGGKARGSGSRFDADGYLAGLERATVEGLDRINLIEQEALRKNAELLKEKKITVEQSEKAVTLIQLNAANERRDIALNATEEQRAYIEQRGREDAAEAEKLAAQQARGRGLARDVIASGDPITALRNELEKRSAVLAEFAAKDQENATLYAEARVALEEETAARIAEVVRRHAEEKQRTEIQAYAAMAGALGAFTEATRSENGKQDAVYRAAFIAQKAFALASSIVAIQAGVAQAAALPFPANLGAMASVVAATAGIISTISGASYGGGRQYGGPVAAGTMYRVNESGRPEMFTAANGNQYMLPTANGQVTSAAQVERQGAGGRTISVVQNFHLSGPTDIRSQQQIAAAAARGMQAAAARNN